MSFKHDARSNRQHKLCGRSLSTSFFLLTRICVAAEAPPVEDDSHAGPQAKVSLFEEMAQSDDRTLFKSHAVQSWSPAPNFFSRIDNLDACFEMDWKLIVNFSTAMKRKSEVQKVAEMERQLLEEVAQTTALQSVADRAKGVIYTESLKTRYVLFYQT
jgi:hypothetical protein